MADKSKIEWTDATWNIITGCTLVDEGCRNCYAAHLIANWPAIGNHPSRKGLARKNAAGEAKFTGEVRFNEAWLDQPLRWKKPRRIFVCAHGDLFHEAVPDEWIDRVFAVMALAPQHTFQVLTKRPDRAREYLDSPTRWATVLPTEVLSRSTEAARREHWPLPNVWLGTSISDQASADLRIPPLLGAPAAVRFVSAEPLLGPVDLTRVGTKESVRSAFPELAARLASHMRPYAISGLQIQALGKLHQAITYYQTPEHMGGFEVGSRYYPRLDWVIVGGESGPHARPMHPDWARSLRDQCVAAGVAFNFKQWGEWVPRRGFACPDDLPRDGWHHFDPECSMRRVGKKAAGRVLDGRTWDQMPGVADG